MKRNLLTLVFIAVTIVGCSSWDSWRFLPQRQGVAFASIDGAVTTEFTPLQYTSSQENGTAKVTHYIGGFIGVTAPGAEETKVYCGPNEAASCELLRRGQHVVLSGTPTDIGVLILSKIKEKS